MRAMYQLLLAWCITCEMDRQQKRTAPFCAHCFRYHVKQMRIEKVAP